ncbi:hypothetical protein U9M48_020572 [Paspalum notatum var. saurae]|uniref:SIAH-type domain-containing protein n=1 Tax=Paspalum notatum var. saurae TaxID=547442 RepID=A0AAQ3THQ7_PASNO
MRALVVLAQCEAGHRLCSSCHGGGGGGGEGHCRKCDRATAFVHCGPDLDAFVGGFRVPCPFEAYGCGSSVVYHDACAYAPCPCALCPFAASPRMLRDHLAAEHAWRVDALPSYGKPLQLRVPASEAHRLLVVEGDEPRLFVLSVRARAAYWVVSVACVRASAEAGPRFACMLWAQAWKLALEQVEIEFWKKIGY